MRVIFDTNVLISAILWKGKAHELLTIIEKTKVTLCFSEETVEEMRGVLNRNKFKNELTAVNVSVEEIISNLLLTAEVFELPKSAFELIKADPSDDKFLLLAKKSKAKYIVSGDKHLLKLNRFGNIKIIPVSEFLLRHSSS